MKRRHRFALNFLSLCLLAFAIYLNFIKDEADTINLPLANSKERPVGNSAHHTSVVSNAASVTFK